MKEHFVYLSGPIQDRPDEECAHWRLKAAELLKPVRVLDPLIRRDTRGKDTSKAPLAQQVVTEDVRDIWVSSYMLVMYDKPSVGTSMEIRIASKEVRIPVLVVDISGRQRSPWLIYHTTMFFGGLEQACAIIKRLVETSTK